MLTTLEHIPNGFVEAEPRQLHEVLAGPTLIHLPGRREPPLFVSVLLHGDETTGLRAVQRVLHHYRDRELPRALSLFVGNVAAARAGRRRLDGQADYNRVWPGGALTDAPEAGVTRAVVEAMIQRGLFASVDIHNNTGHNPHYGCVNRLDHRFLQLAALFSRTVVYFTRPKGVQSMAFAEHCPAVTVECGQAGDEAGVHHAHEFLDAALRLSQIPDHPVAAGDIDLFHTVAVVRIPETATFDFNGRGEVDIHLSADVERMNFQELPPGTVLGRVNGDRVPVEAWDPVGNDVRERFFYVADGLLCTRQSVMPSMLAANAQAVRDDCLCYLMERIPAEQAASG